MLKIIYCICLFQDPGCEHYTVNHLYPSLLSDFWVWNKSNFNLKNLFAAHLLAYGCINIKFRFSIIDPREF